jgi:Xaa-Pro aminopeptidase
MTTHFGPDFFSANRAKLRAAVDAVTPIVITANGNMQKSGDEPFAFYQDSGFWYLTGLHAPDLVLVMTSVDTYLIVPNMTFEREAFDGAHDPAAYAARSGITSVLSNKDGWKRLKSDVIASKTVATLDAPPAYLKRENLHTLPFRRRLIDRLKRAAPAIQVQDIRVELARLRCIKQPEELKAMQRAIDITASTLNKLVSGDALRTATNEYQLEAFLGYDFRMQGADGHCFFPVVAAGKHGTTIHHRENNGAIAPSDTIILDVGAGVERYASDISRTVSQQPITGRVAEVWHAVAAAQDYAISLIRPGVLPIDYEKAVEQFVGEQLIKLGVTHDLKRETIRHYFPHATSHFIGLDTHDTGDYRAPWQANMVIACEPGIYIPEEGIGVRIEDDILITTEGNSVLSAACPRELTPVQ